MQQSASTYKNKGQRSDDSGDTLVLTPETYRHRATFHADVFQAIEARGYIEDRGPSMAPWPPGR